MKASEKLFWIGAVLIWTGWLWVWLVVGVVTGGLMNVPFGFLVYLFVVFPQTCVGAMLWRLSTNIEKQERQLRRRKIFG